MVKPDRTKEELKDMKERGEARKKRRKEQKDSELSVICPKCKKTLLPTQLVCPAYDGLADSPCPGWVRPRETEEDKAKCLKCVNERMSCLLKNVADFVSYDAKQDEWEREKIQALKAEARAEGKSESEIKELVTFTTRGWKEEPALRPLEQVVLCLARYGTCLSLIHI